MICWGNTDGIIKIFSHGKTARCECEPNTCLKDFAPNERTSQADPKTVAKVLKAVNKDIFLERLKALISIRSNVAEPKYWNENLQLIEYVKSLLISMDFEIIEFEIRTNDAQFKKDDICQKIPKQHIIFATFFSSPKENTILIYASLYMPTIEISTDDLFQLKRHENRFYGRGITEGKGPLLAWLEGIAAWKRVIHDLPVNIKLLIDTTSGHNNMALEEIMKQNKDFFDDVNIIVTYTNTWTMDTRPLIKCSIAGFIYFGLEVKEPSIKNNIPTDGVQREPMSDLCLLMNSLLNDKNQILVPNIERHVFEITQDDWTHLDSVPCSVQDYKDFVHVEGLPHESSKTEMLMHGRCLPSLSMHGIQGIKSDLKYPLNKPSKVIGKFSVKLIADQEVDFVVSEVKAYLVQKYQQIRSVNDVRLRVLESAPPQWTKRTMIYVDAALRAIEKSHGVKAKVVAHMNHCARSISIIKKYCSAPFVLLPFGEMILRRKEEIESIPEHILMNNLHLSVNFITEVANIPAICKCDVIRKYCFKRGEDYSQIMFLKMLEERLPKSTVVVYDIEGITEEHKSNTYTAQKNVNSFRAEKLKEISQIPKLGKNVEY